VLACTFVVFPVLGLAARGLVPVFLNDPLHQGLLFLTLVPSTIQSSIAFTSIARGNVPAAICAGSFSSLAGIVVTPLLAATLLGDSGGGFSAGSVVEIVLQLLVPFVAGQLLRRWIGSFVARHRKVLGLVDRGSILLVVYTAFSEGMVQGIWQRVSPARLGGLLAVEAVLLAVMLLLTWYGARALRFGREDRIAIQFAGSKKSLAAGLPMASVLFGAQASLAVLPLMLFHQMQLMVCAVLAKRRSRDSVDEAAEAVLLAVMLLLTWYGAKALRFGREDRIAIQFAGSKKSLAAGLPMASVLFGAQASLAVLPLMLFHQMQLMVCAVIAKRRSHDPVTEVTAPDRAGRSRTGAGTGTRSG